jgi:hypothetical protein
VAWFLPIYHSLPMTLLSLLRPGRASYQADPHGRGLARRRALVQQLPAMFVSVVLEECFKHYFKHTYHLWALVPLAEIYLLGWRHWWLLVSHGVLVNLSLPVAIVVHLAINLSVLRGAFLKPTLLYITPAVMLDIEDDCMEDVTPLEYLDPNASIEWPASRPDCLPKVGLVRIGPHLRVLQPSVARSCACNENIAARNRICKIKPYASPDAWAALIQYIFVDSVDYMQRTWLSTILAKKGACSRVVEPATFSEWVSHFPGPKRNMYLRVHAEMTSTTWSPPYLTYLSRSDSFVKREGIPAWVEGRGALKAYTPRLISGRKPDYQILTGPWVWSFSKVLQSVWSVRQPICYASGLNSEQLGAWFDASLFELGDDCIAIEVDFRRFDSTYSDFAYKVEYMVYRACGCPSEILKLLNIQMGDCTAKTAGGLKVAFRSTRKSGDPNTSCGNSMLNAFMMIWALATIDQGNGGITAMSPFQMQALYRMVVMGDDNLLLVSRKAITDYFSMNYEDPINQGHIDQLAKDISARMALLGFEPEAIAHLDSRHASFCSGLFWPVNGVTVFGPKIGRFLSKFFFHTNSLPASQRASWLKGVVVGMAPSVSHIPILRAVLTQLHSSLSTTKAMVVAKSEFGYRSSHSHECASDTLSFFYEYYGLNPSEVEELESDILLQDGLCYTVHHPGLDTLVCKDMGEFVDTLC